MRQHLPTTWSIIALDQTGAEVFSHHADVVRSAASLIKVPLAWQFLESDLVTQEYTIEAEDICDVDGSLLSMMDETLPLFDIARRMVSESENNATNIILRELGGIHAANVWLDQHGWTAIHWQRVMLDFVARFTGFDNTTTVRDMADVLWQFNHARQHDQRLQPLYEWLRDSISDDKIVAGAGSHAEVAHKVGDLADVEHDAAIITLADGRWFVLVILTVDVIDVTHTRAAIADWTRRWIEQLPSDSSLRVPSG